MGADNKMFCFQCEQTAGCTACTGLAGVCGKSAEVALLQDELTGALIALARAAENNPLKDAGTDDLMLEGMFTCVTNVSFDGDAIKALIGRVRDEVSRLDPQCADGACEYDMHELWSSAEDMRSLKSLLLFGMRGMAAYGYHAASLGERDDQVTDFLYEGLRAVGSDLGADELLALVLKCGEANLAAMAALERAKKASASEKAKGRSTSRGGSSSRSRLPKGWVQGDWIQSTITEKDLLDMANEGLIPHGAARLPGKEWQPQPEEGECVLLATHVDRGFSLPPSIFFRGFLNFFGAQLHHFSPNTIIYLPAFVSMCENLLGCQPHWGLFKHIFTCRSQTVKKVSPGDERTKVI